jgi:hypothetical protein
MKMATDEHEKENRTRTLNQCGFGVKRSIKITQRTKRSRLAPLELCGVFRPNPRAAQLLTRVAHLACIVPNPPVETESAPAAPTVIHVNSASSYNRGAFIDDSLASAWSLSSLPETTGFIDSFYIRAFKGGWRDPAGRVPPAAGRVPPAAGRVPPAGCSGSLQSSQVPSPSEFAPPAEMRPLRVALTPSAPRCVGSSTPETATRGLRARALATVRERLLHDILLVRTALLPTTNQPTLNPCRPKQITGQQPASTSLFQVSNVKQKIGKLLADCRPGVEARCVAAGTTLALPTDGDVILRPRPVMLQNARASSRFGGTMRAS